MLCSHQDRSSPLPAQADTLQKAQDHQQYRRRNAYSCVPGQKTHQKSGEPHQEEREDQHSFPPDLIAVVTEDHAAQRPGKEGDPKSS